MNHRMISIGKNHNTLSAIAALAGILIVSTPALISALAYNHKFTRDFSNSGNNQEIQQDCGNSCTDTSSNTITSGLTTPSPSPSPGNVSISTTLSRGDQMTLGPNDVSVAEAFCPSGSVVTGGGWGASAEGGGTPSVDILLNVQSGNGWLVQVHNLSDSTIFVRAGATCATINP